MLIGADVSSAGGIPTAIRRAEEMGAVVIQIRVLSNRQWNGPRPSDEAVAGFLEAAGKSHVVATFCHAPYLINLASDDEELARKSLSNLIDNLTVATSIASAGVVLHVGSHLGRGTASVLATLGRTLTAALDEASSRAGAPSCRLLLENTAGGGGTIGRSFEELASLLDAAGGDERLGLCLDTQHLFASGISYATLEEADAVVADFDKAIGLARLGLIHLNDSKVPFGSNRDRHENLGEGMIGRRALGLFCTHPAFSSLPCTLEVPGDGDGPRRKDVLGARRLLASGAKWRTAGAAPS